MAWKLPPDQDAMAGVLGAQDMPLWLQSGMQSAPPPVPYQRGDMTRNMPPARSVGYGEAIANALLPRIDEQGYKGPGIGDAINAALWVIPGMRGSRGGPVMAAEKGGGSGGGRLRWLDELVAERGATTPPAEQPPLSVKQERVGGAGGAVGGKPSPGDTYNAVANMAASGDASALVAHANKFNIPNDQIKTIILQAYDNHRPSATSAYNRFLSARGGN